MSQGIYDVGCSVSFVLEVGYTHYIFTPVSPFVICPVFRTLYLYSIKSSAVDFSKEGLQISRQKKE